MELPVDIKRNQQFSDQEIDTHANDVSWNREIIQGSNYTPLKKEEKKQYSDYLCSYNKFNSVAGREVDGVRKQDMARKANKSTKIQIPLFLEMSPNHASNS